MKRGTALVGLIALLPLHVVHGCSPERYHLRRRLPEETLVTTLCSNLRWDPYRARLDLFYFYMIEHDQGDVIELSKFDAAIAHAISSHLDFCDEVDRPRFAVRLDRNSHRFVSPTVFRDDRAASYCPALDAPGDGTECKFVRGISSIFLDNEAGLAQETAYGAIESALNLTSFLSGITGYKLVQSAFLGPIGENLVILSSGDADHPPGQDENGSNLPTVIAIAAALISFVLTVIFLYGLYRKHHAELEVGGESVKARVAKMQAKRRQYFQTLEDDSHGLEPGWMTTETDIPPPLPNSSITWSVSDLTSDSQSIKSSLRMDRIEEEGPYDGHDDYDTDDTDNDDRECPSSSPGSPAEEEKVEIDLEPLVKYVFDAHFEDRASEASTTKACNHDGQALIQDAVETSMTTQDTADFIAQIEKDPNIIVDETESAPAVRSNPPLDCDVASPILLGCQFLLEDASDEDDSLATSSELQSLPDGEPQLVQLTTPPPKSTAGCTDASSWSDFLTPQQEEVEGSAPISKADMTVAESPALEESSLSDWGALSWWVNLARDLDRSRRIPRLTYHR